MLRKSLFLASVSMLCLAPLAAMADGLDLKRVMLSSGGVGYFEYEAAVGGDGELSLSVPLDQVDDLLKSLVVYDSRGKVGTVSLPGRQALVELFRQLPFDEAALSSPADLLRALSGAEISVDRPKAMQGRLLSVNEEQRSDKEGRVERLTRVSLMTEEGIRQFILEEAGSLAFTDPELDRSVKQALAAIAQHGERDRRTLSLTAPGEGGRDIRVAYVVGAPLWKTSYRLTLPDDATADDAGLQGWAVLENQSGEDWEAVELTLVSGNPVTFRQALYQSYYVDRPEVPVEILGRVLPPVDQEESLARPRSQSLAKSRAASTGVRSESAMMSAMADAAPEPAGAGYAQIDDARAEEGTAQATYRLPQAVSVEDGHTLMVPFIDRQIAAKQVAYYQPGVSGRYPLAAVELTNDGEAGLPAGVITLYQGGAAGTNSYLGDARLGLLPPDQKRLISYAVDRNVTVDSRDRQRQQLTEARFLDGALILTSKQEMTRGFSVTNSAKQPRHVLIETAKPYGWTLIEPKSEALETIGDTLRLTIEVAAGATVEPTFRFERPQREQLRVGDLDEDRLLYLIEARRLPETIKAQLQEVLEVRRTLATLQRDRRDLEQEQRDLGADQQRIRENLRAVPADSDLAARYLQSLSAQEDRLSALAAREKTLRQEQRDVEEELAALIAGLGD